MKRSRKTRQAFLDADPRVKAIEQNEQDAFAAYLERLSAWTAAKSDPDSADQAKSDDALLSGYENLGSTWDHPAPARAEANRSKSERSGARQRPPPRVRAPAGYDGGPRGESRHDDFALRPGPRSQPRQFPAVDAADAARARGPGLPRPIGDRPRSAAAQLSRLLRPLAPARLGARQARLPARRHGRRHARQHAGDARMPLRRADVRRGAQHPQHPPRRGGDRLHARPRRGQGAVRRPRVLGGGRGGAEALPRSSR